MILHEIHVYIVGYNDRYEVYKVCKTFSKDWKFIGLALGIEISILHTIKKDCDGVRQMMFEMITSWLIRETEEQPVPTWNILLTTLSEFDRVEAEKIASNFVCNHGKMDSIMSYMYYNSCKTIEIKRNVVFAYFVNLC